jgi:hypothetical protein
LTIILARVIVEDGWAVGEKLAKEILWLGLSFSQMLA